MQITTIKVQGPEGEVEIARTPEGAKVMAGERLVCTIRRGEDRTHRWAEIQAAARAVYGTTKPGRYQGGGQPNATNSMVHDLADLIERVAG